VLTTWETHPFHQVKVILISEHGQRNDINLDKTTHLPVTSLQLLILMLQLAMCGVAPLDVNPMVGPFPDAFSEWGGKNAYLMLREQQYWRLITPAFLHVGVLHLLANSFCLLYSSALFEREWGSWNWLVIFVISEIGCVGVSSVADPDTIAVGSSGALMGLFAAKLAHVLTYTFFETYEISQDEGIHVDQLGSVLCGLTVVSLLSSFTYVDWSGHMGGLASGFFAGMLVFARPIKSCCFALLWGFLGLAGIAGTAVLVVYFLITETDPDEELADGCEYFRSLYPEGYECGCL
jgi:membrane associated rhomboid family serine protease